MPYHFGITELGTVDVQDGIRGVGCESVAAVDGVCDILVLDGSVESIDCYYAVCLVGEEAGGVVRIENS